MRCRCLAADIFAAYPERDFYTDGHRIEGNWQWATTKETAQITNWDDGQPNNVFGIQDCVVLNPANGWYNDFSCSTILRAICQYP